jgi:hypothetical protein
MITLGTTVSRMQVGLILAGRTPEFPRPPAQYLFIFGAF